jgi:hypothetical protein
MAVFSLFASFPFVVEQQQQKQTANAKANSKLTKPAKRCDNRGWSSEF